MLMHKRRTGRETGSFFHGNSCSHPVSGGSHDIRQRRTSSPSRQIVCSARNLAYHDNFDAFYHSSVACSFRSREKHSLRKSQRCCLPYIHLFGNDDRQVLHNRQGRNSGHFGLERSHLFDVTSIGNAGRLYKNKLSRKMVGRRYRRLDNLDDGLSGTSCLERSQDPLEKGCHIDELDQKTRNDKDKGHPREQPRKKVKFHDSDFFGEDWMEEHLDEPCQIEKRKSLDELDLTEMHVLPTWARKGKRKHIQIIEHTDDLQHLLPLHGVTHEMRSNQDACSVDIIPKGGLVREQAVEDADPRATLQDDDSPAPTECEIKAEENLNETFDEGIAPRQASKTSKMGTDEPQLVSNRLADAPESELNTAKTVSDACKFPENIGMHELYAPKYLNSGEKVSLKLDEGRKCGLCGGGSDGEPPASLLPDHVKLADEQVKEGEKPFSGFSEWDSFGDEPGWLGPLLGPLNDCFGIAGVWVHQECAIWTPEVYFAGVGHIKNLRAALRRGRQLKCNRCAKPGATIGCRIEKCPRTYHLPCARFDGCFFDHKKFLMACDEHLHLFLPRLPGCRRHRNSLNLERIRFKRQIREWKKMAQKSAQLDMEAEEKWQEKAGVDEEFLRRERKRLQRDLTKVSPIMIGGGNEQHNADGWDCVAGLEDVVNCLKEMVILPLLYPGAFDSLGVSPPHGVLLHGHPGTGKTLAVKALVGACAKGHKQIAYFARKGADCLGKYVGDAERQLRLLFYLAERYQPSIIFFDEIDGLAPARAQHNDQTQKSVVSTLLALIDGIKSRGSVIVIGATNRPDALDPALRRPGRFDREIYFPLPSFASRVAILALLTKKWESPPTEDTISMLASHTRGFAGADLQALCAQAAMNSLKRTYSVDVLISEAARKHETDAIPPIPDLRIDLSDWATALGQISPPCSWRSGKLSVNSVVSAPMPKHFLPALLWPLVEIILTLHLDPRISLPPILEQAALLLKTRLESDLGTLLTSLPIYIPKEHSDRRLLEDLESSFCIAGMVSGNKGKLDTTKSTYKGSTFRVMISGKEANGGNHLARCILYGFEGILELFNISLTTMLREGGGDAAQGITRILDDVRKKCPCVIYMPRIENWAFEVREESSTDEQRQSSECWRIFIQQVNLMPVNMRIAFVAFCENPKVEVPDDIRSFFAGGLPSSVGFATSEPWPSKLVPCFWVDLSLRPNMQHIFRRAADQNVGSVAHNILYFVKPCNGKPSNSRISSIVTRANSQQMETGNNLQVDVGSDCRVLAPQMEINSDVHLEGSENVVGTCVKNVVKENLFAMPEGSSAEPSLMSSAISILGYELLYHPQFNELRRATSKLKEGPSFITKTPKKRVKPAAAGSGDNSQDREGEVDLIEFKGLVAVSLLAYSGKYLKPKEVAAGVHEVLELLTSQINMKVDCMKKSNCYSHLLQHAASLEDKVFAWAHTMKRFESLQVPCQDNNIKMLENGKHVLSTTGNGDQASALKHDMLSCSLDARSKMMDQDHQNMELVKEDSCLAGNGIAPCPECLKLIKNTLTNSYIQTWIRRGSVASLKVADDVIGACTAAVSVMLHDMVQAESKNGLLCTAANGECSCQSSALHRAASSDSLFPGTTGGSGSHQPKVEGPSLAKFYCICQVTRAIPKAV